LAANRFLLATTNAAASVNHRFVYRTTDDTLWSDGDGSRAQAPVLIADLAVDYNLTARGIFID
jgi:hypothetical protein